jgi:hypothetical protein
VSEVTKSRAERRRQRSAVGVAAAALASARAELTAAAGISVDDIDELRRNYEAARSEVAKAKKAEAATRARIEKQLKPFRNAPEEAFGKLDAAFPVAFFPVRIETRFRRHPPGSGTAGDLLVRIYPDSILANEHEPLLTKAEVEAGRAYWRRAWVDGDERDAWAILLKKSMAPRAAWIVAATRPQNEAARPTSGSEPAPQFGEVETRPDGWHRAPEARGLPERWIVSTWRGGRRIHLVSSEPIREGLALTFRLSADGTEDEGLDEFANLTRDGLSVEPPVLWAYDYDEAVKAGMAVTIPLTEADFTEGFSRLTMMGVRTSEAPFDQAIELEETLTSNNHSRGVAFVPQGSKTNNSTENPSDYPPADPAGAVSFKTYRSNPLADPGSDGERFMRALGLHASTADHFWGAERDERASAVAMGDCLWPVTLGYFLREMMAPNVSPEMAEALRVHAHDHVRGRGPYAALRVGPAPYGLLPVSPLAAWPEANDRRGLDAVMPPALGRLAGLWLEAAANVPRIGRTDDPDADLIATLAMDASAQEVQLRRAFGYDATWNLWTLFGLQLDRLDEAQIAMAAEILETLGEPLWDPRVLHLNFAAKAYDFAGPLIEDAPLSETQGLAFNYLNWLRTTEVSRLKDQAPPATPAVNALLYLMLRHGMLAEFDASARRLLDWRSLLDPAESREAELVGVMEAAKGTDTPSGRTAWERLETKIPGVTGGRTLAEFLDDRTLHSSPQPQPVADVAARLQNFRESLQHLENLPTAELHRLFTETLDISSHRLDAWLIGLYTKRLEEMREANPEGIYIGGYGWVENLTADPPPEMVPVTGPDGREDMARVDPAGYVHSPSMLHAAAAAVLRSAYLSRSGAGREPYAIDLSSRRVRTALWLVDTVREDQPLGAALGYEFERGLHQRHPDVELDRFIDEFRNLYPLVANKAEDSGEPAESVAARNVVDGLRLHAAYRDGTIPFSDPAFSPDTDQRKAIDQELERLDDSIDAVSDLMTSEAVFQIVKGSTAGVAASLDSLAKGTRAPDIEIAATPRSGTVLHQRCIIVLGNEALSPDWQALPPSLRADAAPELNAWLGRLFGPPDAIACQVQVDGGSPVDVTVADLELQPIDFFYLARGAESGASGSDFDHRIAWHVAGTTGPDRALSIDYETALSSGTTTFAQAFEIASAIGKVLGLARPLAHMDLLPPELESRVKEAVDFSSELDPRATSIRAELDQTVLELKGALEDITAAPANPDLGPVRTALLKAARLGVPGTFPASRHLASTAAQDVLVAAAEATLKALSDRATTDDKSTGPIQRLQALFGKSFIAIPRFRPAAPDLFGHALQTEPDFDGRSDADIEGWLALLARVREPIAAWRQLVIYQRVFGRLQQRPRITQLPLVKDPLAKWAALPHGAAERPPSGLVSIAFVGDSVPQAGAAWSCLLLDSWPELIPNAEEDAGIAFHHDAPGAQAPQAILLAVPPPGHERWSFDLLEASLLHTLELARIRAVDLSQLPSLGQLLPTAFLAANPAKATIATSFAGLLKNDAVIASDGT